MPRLVRQFPSSRHHRPSGQAVVTLSGKDIYFGPISRAEYDRIIAEGLANGRRPIATKQDQAAR